MSNECLHDYPHWRAWCEYHTHLYAKEQLLILERQKLDEQRRTNDLLQMQLEDQGVYKPRNNTYNPPPIVEKPQVLRRRT